MTSRSVDRAMHLLSGRAKELLDRGGAPRLGDDEPAPPGAARTTGSLRAASGIVAGSALYWMTEGACIERQDIDWFPSEAESGEDAKAVCRACPVTAACLAHALARHEYGVWGGTTERERRVLRAYIASRPPGKSSYIHGV